METTSLRLLLVRHGESIWNKEERIQGQRDVPLSERGREQAIALGKRLKGIEVYACYASPLRRAMETAELILKASGNSVSVVALPELTERNFGEWEEKCIADLKSQAPDEFAQWVASHYLPAPPKGESGEELLRRVGKGLERILSGIRERGPGLESEKECSLFIPHPISVLIVGHSGSIKALICLLFHLPLESFAKLKVDNASLTVLEIREGKPYLCLFNDTCHLEDSEKGREIW